MPAGPTDIDRLAGTLGELADQLESARAALEGLQLEGAAPADPPAPAAPVRAQPDGWTPPTGTTTTPTTTVPRSQVASLAGVPLVSAGLVEAVVGPIVALAELDAVEERIRRFDGVVAVGVHRLEGDDALLLIELRSPTPLADMLREDLGRPVSSCRLAEGRIVVEFAPE